MGQNSSADWAIIASVVTDSLTPTTTSFHSYGRDFYSASNSQTCVNTQEIFGNLVSLSGLQLLKTTRIYRPWIAYYTQFKPYTHTPTQTHTHTDTHTHTHTHVIYQACLRIIMFVF